MGADTKATLRGQTLRGQRGALEIGNLRLVEDGSERSGALVSNNVAVETTKRGVGWGW